MRVSPEPHSSDVDERRARVRFPLSVRLRYRSRKAKGSQSGAGQSVNISSYGLLFVAEHALHPGDRLELALEWPAPLEGGVPLQLCVRGRVVRTDGNQAAIEIDHHEFRTTRRSDTSEPSVVPPRLTS